MRITAQHATPDSIAKFGKVVNPPNGIPTAEQPEYKFWSNISSYLIQGETEVGICTVYRQPKPEVSIVERHMHTPEILIPIDAPFILPLMEEDGAADIVHAFRV